MVSRGGTLSRWADVQNNAATRAMNYSLLEKYMRETGREKAMWHFRKRKFAFVEAYDKLYMAEVEVGLQAAQGEEQ